MESAITDHDNLCWMVGSIKRIESQINYIVNNFLVKQIMAVTDKMHLLIGMAGLLYNASGGQTSKRVAKIMMLFAKMSAIMFEKGEVKNDKSKFLMGSLYALGGLLKIEAKSYLMTMNERYTKNPEKNEEKFILVASLSNPENPIDEAEAVHIRHLDEDDVKFFKSDFAYIVIYFIKSVTMGLEKSSLNNDNLDLLLDLTQESFYDDMKILEAKDPKKLDTILSSHFITKFLLDVLQFSYAYYVVAEP